MPDQTDTQSSPPIHADALPDWLRTRYANVIQAVRTSVNEEAARTGRAAGVVADRRVRSLLENLETDRQSAPSNATAAAYRRDYDHMMAENRTPFDKATTFQHYNRLRSGFRYCETENIRELRKQADQARRAKQTDEMKRLTLAALERVAVFEAMFIAGDRPTWGKKAAALRAAGGGARPAGKSKRAAGRCAPTPDQLLMQLAKQDGRAARVELPALCFALFGVRPAELKKGARLVVEGERLSLIVQGAKVDEVRGQKSRTLTIAATRTPSAAGFGQSLLAVRVLREAVAQGREWVQVTDADLTSVRRAMREVQPGLSPYAYRHARASDAKATQDSATVAAWMGHATDRAQSYYGNRRSGSGAVTVEAAIASKPVRAVKTLPPTLAQRLAKSEAMKHAKIAARSMERPILRTAANRRGPRLR